MHNERLRRKRTEYHFTSLTRLAARLRSTAPSDAVFHGCSKRRGSNPKGFKDVDNIPIGSEFSEYIDRVVTQC